MALEAPVEPGSGGIGIDELPCYHQKIVYGKEKTLPQLHDDLLLDGAECGIHLVWPVGAIDLFLPVFPFPDGISRDVVFPCEFPFGEGSLSGSPSG